MIKWSSGIEGGFTSGSKWKYFHVNYEESKIDSICKDKLNVPCYILVLPDSFQDAELLYATVKELYVAPNWKGLFWEKKIVIGNFCKSKALCVATNATTRNSFVSLSNAIIKRLGIKDAYIKDGFSKKIGWLTASDGDPDIVHSEEDILKWFDIEEAAEDLYPQAKEWAKSQDTVAFKDIQDQFRCDEDVAIAICQKLFDNSITDWRGNVRKHPTKCAMCGKEFDFWDYNESVHLRHAFGFGSKHDTNKIDVWLCAQCADKLMDMALPLFKEDPLEHYEDLPPATYTDEEIKVINEKYHLDISNGKNV